ncbi:MAG: hypothetical protein RBQ91_01545 [Acholeplasma sp.]|nr:hypothetical protein [Acholeplasma sp.]
MDKKELYAQLTSYIEENKIQNAKRINTEKIHLERNTLLFKNDEGLSKYEVFFDIIRHKLNYTEAEYLLNKHHYHFDPSNEFDLILKFCIKEGIYEIHKVNDLLMHFSGEKLNTL